MENGRTLLLGLPEVTVESVELRPDGVTRRVHLSTEAVEAACPECGVFSSSLKQNATTRPGDLPYGEAPLELRWHKRRWRCQEAGAGGRRSPSAPGSCHRGRG